MAKLQATNVRMEYYQPRTGNRLLAIEDLSLGIEEGQFVSIVGPSGCGKTTFLRIIGGLVQQTGGELHLDGNPITGPGRDRAIVFQESSLFPWFTVQRNVGYGLECRGIKRSEIRERVRPYIKMAGLEGFDNHYPYELSGGMQQRVNLSRALATDPELLLMDEPFASLDAQTREMMQAELLSIWQEASKTVLFITHQIDEAVYLSDRVIVMSARPGRIIADVAIDIPRPRSLKVKRQPEFLAYVDEIWDLIESQVRRTMATDRVVSHESMSA